MSSTIFKDGEPMGVYRGAAFMACSRMLMPIHDPDGITGDNTGATGVQAMTLNTPLIFRGPGASGMGVRVGTEMYPYIPMALDFTVTTATSTFTVVITGLDHFGNPVVETYNKTGTASVYAHTYRIWSKITSIIFTVASAPADTVAIGYDYTFTGTSRRLALPQALKTSLDIMGCAFSNVAGGTANANNAIGVGIPVSGAANNASAIDSTNLNSSASNNTYGMTPRILAQLGIMSCPFGAYSVAPTGAPEYEVRIAPAAFT